MNLSTTRPRSGSSFGIPERLSKPELVAISERLLAEPDIAISRKEDIFRIEAAGLDWDIGAVVYDPVDAARNPVGPDGRKIGFFVKSSAALILTPPYSASVACACQRATGSASAPTQSKTSRFIIRYAIDRGINYVDTGLSLPRRQQRDRAG